MRTVVVTPPAPILDAPTLRARLGLTDVGDDTGLAAYIAAATAVLDGPDGWLGRALGLQTLEVQASHFPECWQSSGAECFENHQAIRLPCPPVVSITSVTYVDAAGVTQTIDPGAYARLGRTLSPAYGLSWPSGRRQPGAVVITYQAGYAAGEVPAPIIQAIVLSVASMQSMSKSDPLLKQDMVTGVGSQTWETTADVGAMYDRAAQALLAPYRVIE